MKDSPKLKSWPAEVYEALPETLSKMCESVPSSDTTKDMFLLGALGVLSGLMPSVRFQHGSEWYSTHLYVVVAALPGTGKGVLRTASLLFEKTDERIRSQSAAAIAQWEMDQVSASEIPNNPNIPNIPRPPDLSLSVGANTTAPALESRLALHPEGLIMFSTEVDTLGRSNSSREHGNFTDLLRKSYHHEPHIIERKGDGTKRIPAPRLALVMSGTKAQFPSLLNNNTEDGTLSRFLYLQVDDLPRYCSQRPTASSDAFREMAEDYSDTLSKSHQILEQRSEPLCVLASKSGWDYIDLYCKRAFDAEREHREGALLAVVNRASLNAFRIATILTILRLTDSGKDLSSIKSVEISADDMETALKIAFTCADHLKSIAGTMSRSLAGGPQSSSAFEGPVLTKEQERFQSSLPEGDFSSKDMFELARIQGISQSKIYRWIDKFPLVTKVDHGLWHKKQGQEFQEFQEFQEYGSSLIPARASL